jgi:predicted RecA/RadA family phage recombinase
MATNQSYPTGRYLEISVPSGTVSGDPVNQGKLAGVALYDEDSDGNAVIDREGVYALTVKAQDTSGSAWGSDVTPGTDLYIDDGSGSLNAGDITPDDSNGTFIGRAYGTVSNDSSSEIDVVIGK